MRNFCAKLEMYDASELCDGHVSNFGKQLQSPNKKLFPAHHIKPLRDKSTTRAAQGGNGAAAFALSKRAAGHASRVCTKWNSIPV
jgi:hypothetical protein